MCFSFFAFFAAKKINMKITGPIIYFGLLAALACTLSNAFPPAPSHTLYGIVRDEIGNPLDADSAEVILESATGTTVKTYIFPGLAPDANYRLFVQIDAAVTADIYKPTALRKSTPYKLRVRIGNSVYLPIEMQGDFSTLGEPAQSTRLDLTLGEDANGNGIPDAWERAMLTGKDGNIDPDGDLDGDGLSNLAEYLAGTHAFDRSDGFSLTVLEVTGKESTLEFMTIRGRTYTLFGSSNLNDWGQVQFRVSTGSVASPELRSYSASATKPVRITVPAMAEHPEIRFFKLRVE